MTLPTGKHDLMAPWNPINHISDFCRKSRRSWDLEAVILRMHGASFAYFVQYPGSMRVSEFENQIFKVLNTGTQTQKESLSLSGYFYPPKSVSYLEIVSYL